MSTLQSLKDLPNLFSVVSFSLGFVSVLESVLDSPNSIQELSFIWICDDLDNSMLVLAPNMI